ncbi:cobalt ECF transporter T component CbiQ [Oscillatoria sp. CS-180]|uniref:cobalt ECF transporter T component CbiQ n=1 Tax=Oscillatoria sp. CS-180 TaxID=3021720 RepID=UPI00232D9C54|nr:cobalt ECF transporter T component CbiQ [Oscillatoria sp. CS-180]MDB9525508.1 cobalt ECF transporter T component CbiQ [Oscillatoria sp. CS-180]
MAIALRADIFVAGNSPIHCWAVRPKLLSLLGLMFAISLVSHLALIPWVLIVVGLLYRYSQLPWQYLLKRLTYPGIFIVAMVGLLPWISGETVLWQGYWLTLRLEGLQTAALIAGRFLAILTTGFILLGTTPFLDMLKAMRSLGLPSLLTDMALLTYRYLFDVAAQLSSMRQAMRLRGYGLLRQTVKRQWSWLAALFGSLLLRSYERSHRVYKAMCLRGYGQSDITLGASVSRSTYRQSWLTTAAILSATLSFVIGEWILTYL